MERGIRKFELHSVAVAGNFWVDSCRAVGEYVTIVNADPALKGEGRGMCIASIGSPYTGRSRALKGDHATSGPSVVCNGTSPKELQKKSGASSLPLSCKKHRPFFSFVLTLTRSLPSGDGREYKTHHFLF